MKGPDIPRNSVVCGWILAAACLFIPFNCAYGQITDALKVAPPKPKTQAEPQLPDQPYVVPKDVVIRSYGTAPPPDEVTDLSQYSSPDQNEPPASTDPPGATAQCADGTYSFSSHRRGTCSHHGGVLRWL